MKKREIIRLTESDLHQIINETVNQYLIQEGFGTKMRNAAIGGMMAMSPMNEHAQQPMDKQPIEQQSVLSKQEIGYIFDEINRNTQEHIEEIQDIENTMREDSEIADIIYSIAFMDETDNFITADKHGFKLITDDTYNALVQKSEKDILVKITYIDGNTVIPNVIVPLDELETALENF